MGLFNLFAIAARNLQNRYLGLADMLPIDNSYSNYYGGRRPVGFIPRVRADRYEPAPDSRHALSNTDVPVEESECPEAIIQPLDKSLERVDHPSKSEVEPEATYFFRRRARLDYKLGLRFDLHAVSQTVEKLSEGDLEALKRFSAAQFGLTVAIDFKGKQVIETNMSPDADDPDALAQVGRRSLMQARQAQQITVQSRHFAAQAFQREATDVMKSLKVTDHDGYRRTVNKFSFRFMTDSRFSFSFLERLNVQTADVAKQQPESLGQYVTSAGNVAEKGTSEMMAAFFNTVGAYLDHAEEQITDQVNRFFDMAVEELGLSGVLTDQARERLVDTVESFFNGVDAALADLRSRFVPSSNLVQPTLPVGEPKILPAEPESPAVVENEAQIAVA